MLTIRRFGLPAAAMVLAAARLAAEDGIRVILVPVYAVEPLPGVNGSSWTTDLWAANWGAEVADVDGLLWDCFLPQCGAAPIAPDVSFGSAPRTGGALHGALLRLESAKADSVGFHLRFRDLSRQARTAGTELPMPPDTAFRNSKFSLLNVPVEESFRRTLRIYELDGTEREARVIVRLFRSTTTFGHPNGTPDLLLGEATLNLAFQAPGIFGVENPGYAELTDLSSIAPLGDAESLRIEIEPASDGLKLWAFVTVIHNESQHATVISPQ